MTGPMRRALSTRNEGRRGTTIKGLQRVGAGKESGESRGGMGGRGG